MAKLIPLLVWLILVCAPAEVALAQTNPTPGIALNELTLEQLGSIEVETVSKQPAEIWRSPAAVFVLTQDDIRRSGATTLAEVLRLVPGVQVSRLDSDHWAVGIRGLASSFSKSLLVLIDGRSVYTPLFGGVFWQVQDTLIEDIDRIEVIRGPGGTIWGANAVNGVINVVTKSSRETVGSVASVGAGNVDEGRFGFRYGWHRSDRLSYRVYGAAVSHDAMYHTDGHDYDQWQNAQAGFRLDASTQSGSLVLQGDLYRGKAGDLVGLASFRPPAQHIVEGLDRISGGNVLVRWQRPIQTGGDIRLQAYYDRTDRTANHFGESRHSFDIDFLHSTPVGRRHSLSLGAGARFNPSDFTTVDPALTFTPEDRSHRLLSAFAQDEIAVIGESLWLTIGSKFEHNSYSGLEIQPSTRLLWRRSARESWWASMARAVRTPSRIDADLRLTNYLIPSPLAYMVLEGAPNFRSETLIGTELGYRRLIGSQLYVDLTAYHNVHGDLAGFGTFALRAQAQPIPHLELVVPYENAIRGTTDGFEISPDWRPADWVRVKTSYAFLTVNMSNQAGHSDNSGIQTYEGSSPRHQGFVQALLTLPGRVEIDQTYRASSRLRSHDIPGYVTADARIGWQFTRSLTASVAGQNLLQAHHQEFFKDVIGPVGIRRSVYASLTWRR